MTSAVTAWDLFLRLITLFSESRPMPPNSSWVLPLMSWGRPARSALNRSNLRSSSGKTLYLRGLDQEEPLQVVQPVGVLGGHVAGLGPVVGGVELPDVVVERGQLLAGLPRGGVAGHRGPALVVDAAVDEHLEVLGLVTFGGSRPR